MIRSDAAITATDTRNACHRRSRAPAKRPNPPTGGNVGQRRPTPTTPPVTAHPHPPRAVVHPPRPPPPPTPGGAAPPAPPPPPAGPKGSPPPPVRSAPGRGPFSSSFSR